MVFRVHPSRCTQRRNMKFFARRSLHLWGGQEPERAAVSWVLLNEPKIDAQQTLKSQAEHRNTFGLLIREPQVRLVSFRAYLKVPHFCHKVCLCHLPGRKMPFPNILSHCLLDIFIRTPVGSEDRAIANSNSHFPPFPSLLFPSLPVLQSKARALHM